MVGQRLGHYHIVEKIGAGGMGVVYRAHDDRLDRDVALKVLPPGTLTDEAARKRFRKEALALSKLNHPNIAIVHDFDTQDGIDFIVMEFISGQTLSERLHSGALSEKEIASLGGQIAAALEDAHEHNVVHRDLKPGNIRVTPKGQVKVLDFGLATLLQPGDGADVTRSITAVHSLAGTLPYMAPERLRGEPADARSDIYAAGTVLYEMATGGRPFPEKLPTALIDDILHKAPRPPAVLRPELSPKVEAVILKCLEKEPENRYQSAKELAVDLRRMATPIVVPAAKEASLAGVSRRWAIVGAMAIVLFAGAVIGLRMHGWREQFSTNLSSPQIKSLAVLPLENLSGDPSQEYFADGMTEQLIADLGQISALRVISRTSVMQYKGVKRPLPQIARELDVDAVVEGSVERAGDRVRITAQLIHAPTDRHLWAHSYERDLRDVLALQDEVAQAIAIEIKANVTPRKQQPSASARSINPQAYELYLEGRYFWNKRTEEGLRKGLESFQGAVAIAPDYALAYAGVADSYLMLVEYGTLRAKEAFPRAKAAAQKALELDDTLAEAHTSLASIKEDYDWDWSGAEREFRRANELNPSYATSHQWYAEFLAAMGRFDEARPEMKRAHELDPLSLIVNTVVGEIFYESRQYAQATEQLRKALELDPNFAEAHRVLGETYEQQSKHEEAVAEFQKAITLSGGSAQNEALLGEAFALWGKSREARKVLERLKVRSKQSYISPDDLSLVYAGLGEKDKAFELLEEGYAQRVPSMINLKVDPKFDPLRSDPRFQNLLHRIGLPP